MADAIIEKQDSIGLKSWQSFASDAGVSDTAGVASCVQRRDGIQRVDAGVAVARAAGFTGISWYAREDATIVMSPVLKFGLAQKNSRTTVDVSARDVGDFVRAPCGRPSLSLTIFSIALTASLLNAQPVPTRELSRLEVQSSVGFTQVIDVRELADGSLLVLDFAEQLVHLLNASLSGAQTVARTGSGPEEYSTALNLLRLGSGRTGIVHTSATRVLVVDSIGRFRESVAGRERTAMGQLGSAVEDVDEQGRFFALAASSTSNGSVFASGAAAVERWTPGSTGKRDTVAVMRVAQGTSPAFAIPGRITGVFDGDFDRPFRAQVQWAVASDGRVAVVYPDPYVVEIFDARGSRFVSTKVPVEGVPLTEEHRRWWVNGMKEAHARALSRAVGRDANGQRIDVSRLGIADPPVPATWPAFLPTFVAGALSFDASGRLWVRRIPARGSAPTFDVFNTQGILSAQVVLPSGTRFVGLGRDAVYVVRKDSSEVERIERYRFGG